MGTGHLKRCLSLAETLGALGVEIFFVWRDIGLDCSKLIENNGFRAAILTPCDTAFAAAVGDPPHSHWAEAPSVLDASETSEALRQFAPHWVVIDHYSFDARWHEAVRQALNCKIAVIDDLGDRLLLGDILVDHNPDRDHRHKYARSLNHIGKLLGGPSFALLAPGYSKLKPIAVRDNVRSIGIFLGGVDAQNLSPMVLKACRNAGFDGPVEIAATSAYTHLEALIRSVADDGSVTLSVDQPDLMHFFQTHDLQIGAGGGATWERCRVGVPAIVLATADNQRIVTSGLGRVSAALCLDSFDSTPLVEQIKWLLADKELRVTLGTNASRLVDGRGCQRVALAMAAETISVRPATMADAELVHSWRNAPSTRAVSIDPSEIALDAHLIWFAASLSAPDRRRIFIGHVGPVDVGVVRFDALGDEPDGERWEISIYLDPELSGLGLGSALLIAAEQALLREQGGVLSITAQTLSDNRASQQMFRRCGYQGETCFAKRLAE
jgi:UDP-2,4-diacetamido-2,4,6-trideoxy-beta-L-altropyranose hydrolase